jgi:hypothetical protein
VIVAQRLRKGSCAIRAPKRLVADAVKQARRLLADPDLRLLVRMDSMFRGLGPVQARWSGAEPSVTVR